MNERIDEGPAGKLLEGFIEVIDEFYSSNLAEDTLRGLKENASRGFFNGGSIPVTDQAVGDFRNDAELELEAVEKQAEDARARLRKLYSLIEVGKLEADDLGPRIRELRTSVEEYDSRLEGLRQKVGESRPHPLEPEAIKATARDLRALLAKGSLIERASFVRSFVKRVVVNFPNVTVE